MATVTLRPITPDDLPFLYRVYASTREEELALVDWEPAQKEAFVRMQFTAQHRFYQEQFPAASYQVVLTGDQPVGRLYLDRRAEEICIVDIALLPEARNGGIGTGLLKDVLAEADRAGKPVRIHVEQFNPAQRLYLRLGFQKIGETGVYFLMERPPNRPGLKNEGCHV
jgi:GNAT superfamily N-acetyltransferase